MTQLPLVETPYWTVSELTRYLRDLLESDPNLGDLWVQGEISNLSHPSSGHLYFTLKDSSSALKCVMWRSLVERLTFIPRDGQAVEAHGGLNIYEAAGQYQLYTDLIRPIGEGALYQEFLRLKARLEAEGLFDPERKRPLPTRPQLIGIVTSPTGAALRDILNTLQRRYPIAEVILAPTPVQGEEAPSSIINALETLNQIANPDVILIARGGGSIEDLWAFNDEGVARAIAASKAPIISGVGHETDFTIADFVSDLRAPTPTAAAELATPSHADLLSDLDELIFRIERVLESVLTSQRWELKNLENLLGQRSPLSRVRSGRQRVDDLAHRTALITIHGLQMRRTHLSGEWARLDALNPLSVLKRGFAVVTHPDGPLVRSVTQVAPGDPLAVTVQDGKFGVEVQDLFPETR